MKSNSTRSYLMFITAMLIYGTIGIFRRFIPLSSAMLACSRGLIGAAFLMLFRALTKKGTKESLDTQKVVLLAITGALIGINWILLFEAYNFTTVPVATLCYYMEPTFVVLLSPIFLHEKMTGVKCLGVLLSLFGMVLVSGILENGVEGINTKGILLGLGAAVFYTIVVLLTKCIQVEDEYRKISIELFSASVVLLPYLMLTEKDFSWESVLPSLGMILLVGIVHTGIAYGLYFGSFKGLKGQSIAVLSYIDPVSALILSAIFLKEKLTLLGIVGAVLILGAALMMELMGNSKEREA